LIFHNWGAGKFPAIQGLIKIGRFKSAKFKENLRIEAVNSPIQALIGLSVP